VAKLTTQIDSIPTIQIIVDGIKIDTTNCFVSIDLSPVNPKLTVSGSSIDPAQAGELVDRLRVLSTSANQVDN
jgi:hypothetical protein